MAAGAEEPAKAYKEFAKAKYIMKVCGYLGIDVRENIDVKKKSEAAFEKLYANMKAAFTAFEALRKHEYVANVCDYLGIDRSEGEKVFKKLCANMKAAFETLLKHERGDIEVSKHKREGVEVSEEEIKILMAKEIVEDICSKIKDIENRSKCWGILHRILVDGRGFERLLELSEDARKIIKKELMRMVVGEHPEVPEVGGSERK